VSDFLFQASLYAEQVFLSVLIVAAFFFFLTALANAYKRKNGWAQSFRYLGYAFACFFFFKNMVVFPSTVRIDPYDGTNMTFVERNLLSLTNRETKLYLRWDEELNAQIWMKKSGENYYRFFYEKE